MKIGIGLPAHIPGVKGNLLLEWARRADAGPFSTVAVTDRVAHENYEPFIVLAAAAAVTRRVRLLTSVIMAPLRYAGMLTKQAASLDALSGGRLVLGVGLGSREEDYHAAQAPFKGRGKRLDEALALMRQIWGDQPVTERVGIIGPSPLQKGGPEVLIGAYAPQAIRRVGKWADGYLIGGKASEESIEELCSMAVESWKAEGRPGKPRLVRSKSFALGPQAAERANAYMRHYASKGATVESSSRPGPSSPEAIKVFIQRAADQGMDEVIFMPTILELEQVERLEELVG